MGKTIQIIFLMLLAPLSYGQVVSGKLIQEIQYTITFTQYIDLVDKKCAEINDYIHKQKELIRFDTFSLPIHFTTAFGDSTPITQPAYFELLPLEEQDSTLQEKFNSCRNV
jgi:hypothetical protein